MHLSLIFNCFHPFFHNTVLSGSKWSRVSSSCHSFKFTRSNCQSTWIYWVFTEFYWVFTGFFSLRVECLRNCRLGLGLFLLLLLFNFIDPHQVPDLLFCYFRWLYRVFLPSFYFFLFSFFFFEALSRWWTTPLAKPRPGGARGVGWKGVLVNR